MGREWPRHDGRARVRQLIGKIAFVHRALWQRDFSYRWAVLLGPPPLIGAGVAALVLAALHGAGTGASSPGATASWAHWERPVPQESEPFVEQTRPLPPKDLSGHYRGTVPGWLGEVHRMSIDATQDVNVEELVSGTFTLDQTDVPLQRIADAGPVTGLFVGAMRTFFVARTPGLYAFSVRLTRSGTLTADCLVRLGSRHHRI